MGVSTTLNQVYWFSDRFEKKNWISVFKIDFGEVNFAESKLHSRELILREVILFSFSLKKKGFLVQDSQHDYLCTSKVILSHSTKSVLLNLLLKYYSQT